MAAIPDIGAYMDCKSVSDCIIIDILQIDGNAFNLSKMMGEKIFLKK